MKIITATEARKKIYHLVESVEQSHRPVHITSKRANAVLVAESDWRNIQETLYLLSIPGMRESIRKGLKEPIKNCKKGLDW